MAIAQQIFLSTVEYDVLWSHLELGAMPYPLAVPSEGVRAEERARITEEAWAGLTERGLADHSGVHDDLAHLLRLLARPTLSLDAVGDIGEPLRALAVRDRDEAAAAMVTDAGLTVTGIHPTALAGTLTELLPPAIPGPGYAFNFPYRALQAALTDEVDEDVFFGGGEHDSLVRAGMANGDARLLAELVDGRIRGGQFGIMSWNRSRGDSVRGSTLVTWFDTDAGRYLVVREQDWVSVSPADADRIAARLDHALAAANS
jgi:EspG family